MEPSDKGFYYYCEGRTLEDIAKATGSKIGTVKSWMTRHNWVDKKAACKDKDGNIDFDKVKGFMRGKGNMKPIISHGYSDVSQKDINTSLLNDTPENNEFKQYMREILTNSVRHYQMPMVTSDEETEVRIIDYFKGCIDQGLIPTIEGLWLCLGIQKSTFYDWVGGKRGTVRAELLKRARLCIQEVTTQMAIGGKMDKILYMFITKNHYDMHDTVEQTITHTDSMGPQDSKEAIEKRLASRLRETLDEPIIDVDVGDSKYV